MPRSMLVLSRYYCYALDIDIEEGDDRIGVKR